MLDEGSDERPAPSISKKGNRILRVDEVWSRKDRQYHIVKTASSKIKSTRFAKYTLVIKRTIDSKGSLGTVDVIVNSQKLTAILVEIFKDAEGLTLTGTAATLALKSFYYAKAGLEEQRAKESAKASADRGLMDEITVAVDFINDECSDMVTDLNNLLPTGDILYDHLWAIFAPGAVLYSIDNTLQQNQAYKFSVGEYVSRRQRVEAHFVIKAKMIHHSGVSLGWGTQIFRIPTFEGSRKIRSLPIYPIDFHPEPETLRRELTDRGRIYLNLIQKPACKEYSGIAVSNKETKKRDSRDDYLGGDIVYLGRQQNTFGDENLLDFSGRMILDPVAFKNNDANSILLEPRLMTKKIDPKDVTEDEMMFCNHRLLGFSFHNKDWGAFAVSHISEVAWNEAAFDRLILEDRRRDHISTLVKAHRAVDTFDDIIKGKGKGLVGLLKGGPGVGKSLTAEAVAEMAQKPLYILAAGELDTQPREVDTNLTRALEISRRWGCVLLIDEADVFLQRREVNGSSSQRNSLDIDEAFRSRIHFSWKYPSLDENSRFKLWKDFIEHMPDDIDSSSLNEEDLSVLARRKLNGREIKNTLSCAASIVRYRSQPLTLQAIVDTMESLRDDSEDEAEGEAEAA